MCLVQFDAYLPAIAAIDGDSHRFTEFFLDGLPGLLLDRLDAASIGKADAGTRGRLADTFSHVAGDIAR